MDDKYPTSFRLSNECRRILKDLCDTLGMRGAQVIELAIRSLAPKDIVTHARKVVVPPLGRPKTKR